MMSLNTIVFFYCCVFATIFELRLGLPIANDNAFSDMYYSLINAESKLDFREIQAQYMRDIMNVSVDPCEDFYQYACGNWENVAVRGAVTKKFGTLDSMTAEQDYVLSKLFAKEIVDTDILAVRKLKSFFKTCTDRSTWDYAELKSFLMWLSPWPLLDDSWTPDTFDWLNVTAHAHSYGAKVIFRQWFKGPKSSLKMNRFDLLKYSAHHVLYFRKNVSNEDAYIKAVKDIFKRIAIDLTGKEEMLREVYRFEKELSEVREANEIGTKAKPINIHIDELSRNLSNANFEQYFRVLGRGQLLDTSEHIYVMNLPGLRSIFNLVSTTKPSIVANDILINIVLKFVLYIENNFSKHLPQTCANFIKTKMISPALYMFTKEYYDEDTEFSFQDMYLRILHVGRSIISNIDWMDDDTKANALEQFDTVTEKVGYDKNILDVIYMNWEYGSLKINSTNFIQNLIKVFRHSVTREQYERLGHAWLINPFSVSATFHQRRSVMVIPLGIMQPPVFHKFNRQYVNYANLGTIIGHELMHGFDVDDIQLYSIGKRTDWTDLRLKMKYFSRVECFYLQYNNYVVEEIDEAIDGGMTLSENLCDNQALVIALEAYKYWLEVYRNSSLIDIGLSDVDGVDLTNIQSFFLSYAQFWCSSVTPEYLRHQVENSQHTPVKYRVLGALSNSPDFAEAFNCPVGSVMNPEDKCKYF